MYIHKKDIMKKFFERFKQIGDKYQCDICSQLFSKLGISRHYRHKHSDSKPFVPGGWNKGLTAESDIRIQKSKEKLIKTLNGKEKSGILAGQNRAFGAARLPGINKLCPHCGKEKLRKKFRKSGRCLQCDKKYQADWYQKNKRESQERYKQRRADSQLFVYEYLCTHPCVGCGESNPLVLEFDHIKEKKYAISRMISDGFNRKSIQREIEKCEVRCANCHRKKTAKDQNWFIYRFQQKENKGT